MSPPDRRPVGPRWLPPIGVSIQRRRVFWALVALVVVPTLLLASYGLQGLAAQRAAAEAQLRERYQLQARALEQAIVLQLGQEDEALRLALRDVPEDRLDEALGRYAASSTLVEALWRVPPVEGPDSPPDQAARNAALRELGDAPSPAVTTLKEADHWLTLVRTRIRDELDVAWVVEPASVDAVMLPPLVGKLFPTEPAVYRVLPVEPELADEPLSLDRLRRELAQELSSEEAEVDRPLAPPFERWRITVASAEELALGSRSSGIWLVLALAAMIVVGVTLMAQAVAQQIRLSRLQTDFVSNVSHELRTPLTSIRMFVETLQSGRVTDPERVEECLGIIAQETDRLSRKIERVLSWARIEAGRRLYDMQAQKPRAFVDAALAAFAAQHLVDDRRVDVGVGDDLPLVRVDTDAMAEALLNLLSNAAKYGGEKAHIGIYAYADRRFVNIAVRDDGPGIPRAERRRIFEKFYRPDLLQTRRAEGSGLGLAIVRAIVQAHRGRVDVESVEGQGATFTVRLPRA